MIEIELEIENSEVHVRAFGMRAERPEPHSLGPEFTPERLLLFTEKVGDAIGRDAVLDASVVKEAQALYTALFQGELRDVLKAETAPLIRLMLRDQRLQKVPWEGLCSPRPAEGFLASGSQFLVARGVSSPKPFEPRPVDTAIRLLAIAPGGESELKTLKAALGNSIESGHIIWLEPVTAKRASAHSRSGTEALRVP